MTDGVYLISEHATFYIKDNCAEILSLTTNGDSKYYYKHIKTNEISDYFCKYNVNTVLIDKYICENNNNYLPICIKKMHIKQINYNNIINNIPSHIEEINLEGFYYGERFYMNYLPHTLNIIKFPKLTMHINSCQLDKLPPCIKTININHLYSTCDFDVNRYNYMPTRFLYNLPIMLNSLRIDSRATIDFSGLSNIKELYLLHYTGRINISALPDSITTLIINSSTYDIIYKIPRNITTFIFNISFIYSIFRLNKNINIQILCPNLKKVDIMWVFRLEPLHKIEERIHSILGDSINIKCHEEHEIKDLYKLDLNLKNM